MSSWRRWLALSLLAVAGSVTAAAPPRVRAAGNPTGLPLRFHSEDVRLYVEPDSLRVEGTYWFVDAGKGGGPSALFYPYPADSLLGGARTLSLEARPAGGGAWRAQHFTEMGRNLGARWLLTGDFGDTIEVHTIYRQALRASYARYVVTTTRAWAAPLSRAYFEIHLPPGVRPERFSFPFREVASPDGPYFVYEARDFLPDRDIVVQWSSGRN
jgi:hypothetical protein